VSDVIQMLKHGKKFMILKFIILVSIFINIYFEYNSYLLIMIALLSFSTLIIINDYIRNMKLKDYDKYVIISLLSSICAASMLQYFVPGLGTTIYTYCFLFEIFQFRENIFKRLLSVHLFLFFSITALHANVSTNMNIFLNLGITLLAYFGTSGMIYYQKTIEIEKEEIKQLNEKLKLANIKLQEYALQVEEITISRERTRVAQELHDSLGHSLMALTMHIEFAKKICTSNPKKVEEVLAQSEKIAKGSITDLRKAVTLLNTELEVQDLNTSIEKLIRNFYLVSNLEIAYTKNEGINELSPFIKTSLYKTIQESITNSLKHGNATEITIKIVTNIKSVEVVITDNGIGCNNIIKSNGLNGIENRINSIGGATYYFSQNDLGFGIRLFIPI